MLTRHCEHLCSETRYQTRERLRDDDNNANDDDDSNNYSDVTIVVIKRMQVVKIMKFSQRCCLRLKFYWTLNAASLVSDISKGAVAFIRPWEEGTEIVINVGDSLTSDRE